MSIEGLSKDLLKSVAGVMNTSAQKEADLSKANSVKLAEKLQTQSMRPRDTYEAKVAAEENRAPLRRLADAASAVFASSSAERAKLATEEKKAIDKAYAKMGAAKPVAEGKEHTVPKTDKEKKLAALAEPKDKITHADVIKGRLTKEEEEFIDTLNADLDEAAIDDLKDKMAAKKETDADELKFKNDDKPASVKRTVKGKQYNGEKDKPEVDEASCKMRKEEAEEVDELSKAYLQMKKYQKKKMAKEEVEALDEREDSPVKGTRKVASYGDVKHTAEVRYNPEYQEYSVHHYKDGKHQGEDSVSYHYDDKEDAHNTAKHEVKRSQGVKEDVSESEESRDPTGQKIDNKTIANMIATRKRIADAEARDKESAQKLNKEEVEQVDEISKATLGSYVTKASKNASMIALGQMDAEHKAKKAKSPAMKDAWTRVRNNNQKRRWKREDNINKAVAKLTKEEEDRVAEIFNTLSKD